eukprot:213545-Chlamydomonas_euryale.AAC.1
MAARGLLALAPLRAGGLGQRDVAAATRAAQHWQRATGGGASLGAGHGRRAAGTQRQRPGD